MKYIMGIICFMVGFVCADAQKEHFLQAQEYFKNNQMQEALEQLQAIENPGVVTWYMIGRCYKTLSQHDKALIAFKYAEKQATGNNFFAIHSQINECCFALGIAAEPQFYVLM